MPDDAVVGQVAQALARPAGLDHRDGLEAPAVAADRIQHRRVVGAVAARLDQQRMLHAVLLEHARDSASTGPVLVRRAACSRGLVEGEPAMIDDVGMAIDPALARDSVASRYRGLGDRLAGRRIEQMDAPCSRPQSPPPRRRSAPCAGRGGRSARVRSAPTASSTSVSAPSGSTATTVAASWARGRGRQRRRRLVEILRPDADA